MIRINPKNNTFPDARLETILDHRHKLYQLAQILDWDALISYGLPHKKIFQGAGRPSKSPRLLISLHYFKYMDQKSDACIIQAFAENPYWQYFCGYKFFQHRLPCHSTSLGKWRKRVGKKVLSNILQKIATVSESIVT